MLEQQHADETDPNLKPCAGCGGVLAFVQTHGYQRDLPLSAKPPSTPTDEWKCLHCGMTSYTKHDGRIRWARLNWTGAETWQARINGDWYLVERSEKRPDAWCIGYSNKPGDTDSIMRGVYYDSLETAQAFCEHFAKGGS